MPTLRSSPRVLMVLAASSVLLAACGGSSATPTPQAAATAAPSQGATPVSASAPASTPGPAASVPQSAGGDGSQYANAAVALDNLTSYRFTMKVSGTGAGFPAASGQSGSFSMDGTVVLRPQKAMSVSMTGFGGGETGGLAMKYIIVGDRAWMDLGGTPMELPADQTGSIEQTFESFSPQKMFGQTFDGYLDGMQRVGEEQRNGVATIHLAAEPRTLDQLAGAFGAAGGAAGGWKMDVWVAKDGGYMVGAVTSGTYDASGTAATMLVAIDISGIDDPANRVVAPS